MRFLGHEVRTALDIIQVMRSLVGYAASSATHASANSRLHVPRNKLRQQLVRSGMSPRLQTSAGINLALHSWYWRTNLAIQAPLKNIT